MKLVRYIDLSKTRTVGDDAQDRVAVESVSNLRGCVYFGVHRPRLPASGHADRAISLGMARSYERIPVAAPRLSGVALRALVGALESGSIGSALAKKLKPSRALPNGKALLEPQVVDEQAGGAEAGPAGDR
jgi:hypothetical protein